MEMPVCRILIADTRKAMQEIVGVLEAKELEVLHAYGFEEALTLARERKPHLCIVGYHFDEARPYRLIQQLRAELDETVPIFLIRALSMGEHAADDAHIKESYRALGVNEYLALYEHATSAGWQAARARLAEEVTGVLRSARCLF